MPRSRLFSLQARRASAKLAHLAQALQGTREEARQSSAMQGRLGALMDSLTIPQGAVNVAQLRHLASLSERLGAERDRQGVVRERAEDRLRLLRAEIQDQMRRQHHAQEAASAARFLEARERQQRQDDQRPPRRTAP